MLNTVTHNVILVTIDSLRADYVSCINQFRKEGSNTPNLDEVAKNGVVFTNCFSQGTTTAPSITSLLTSTYPLDYGGHSYLTDSRITLAEMLKNAGYDTAAFHSNPFLSRLRNFNKGFDVFKENLIPWQLPNLLESLPLKFSEQIINKFFRIVRNQPYLPAPKINRQACEWLQNVVEPFFLWIHYMDVHGPYLRHRGFSYFDKIRAEMVWRKAYKKNPQGVTNKERQMLLNGYENEIKFLDNNIKKLSDELAELNLWDQSLVIITSDHGDEFGEHGQFGHMNLPYNTLSQVPLILKLPSKFNIGEKIITHEVRLLDIVPTILDLLNIQPTSEEKSQMAGQSLAPLIKGSTSEYKINHVITEKFVPQTEGKYEELSWDRIQASVKQGSWKFILDNLNQKKELYDLNSDPYERKNMISDQKEIADKLNSFLVNHLKEMLEGKSHAAPQELEEKGKVKQRLKDLGYLD